MLLRILSTCHTATDKCQNSSNNEKSIIEQMSIMQLYNCPKVSIPQVIEIVSVKEWRQVQQWPKDCQHSLTNHYRLSFVHNHLPWITHWTLNDWSIVDHDSLIINHQKVSLFMIHDARLAINHSSSTILL